MIVHGEGRRYVMSVVSGYEIHPGGHGKRTVTVAILDSWECYRTMHTYSKLRPRAERMTRARKMCDRLNAEHEAWERDGCVA